MATNRSSLPSEQRLGVGTVGRKASPFDHLASIYDAWFEREGRLIFAIEVKALQGVLHVLPKPWLEVGTGSGRFAQALGIETGVEPSPRLLEMARRRGITGFLGRGEQQFFDEETFGSVFLILTLCFVESPQAVLREASRVLKPEGKLALGLILRDSPWGQLYDAKGREGHRFYKHATFYSYQGMVDLLEGSGFTVERIVSTLFQGPGRVMGMEEPREGFYPEAGFVVVVAGKVPSPAQPLKGKD